MCPDDAAGPTSPEENRKQYDEWFAANYVALVDAFRRQMGGAAEYTASDAMMSAYAQVRARPFAEPIENPLALVWLAARCKFYQHLRRRYLAAAARPHLARSEAVDDHGAAQLSAAEMVEFLSAELDARQQVILAGRLDGLTNDEIARRLHDLRLFEGCGPDQVKYLWKKLVTAWRGRAPTE